MVNFDVINEYWNECECLTLYFYIKYVFDVIYFSIYFKFVKLFNIFF